MYDTSAAETLSFHRSMVVDDSRTQTFLKAILSAVRPGEVVLDIGAGTGILSLFACSAGARHVYAVEQGPVVGVARELADANGVGDRITFLEGWSTEIELPEPADVLVTETIGNAGFEEGILRWVGDARKRLLVPGARVLPGRLTLMATAVDCPIDYEEVSHWRGSLYGIDFRSASRRAARQLWPVDLSPAHVVCDPVALVEADLCSGSWSAPSGDGVVEARRDGTVHGIGLWFTTILGPDHELSNPPGTADSSWSQVLLPIDEPFPVQAGDELALSVSWRPDGTRWSWGIGPSAAAPTHHSVEGDLGNVAPGA